MYSICLHAAKLLKVQNRVKKGWGNPTARPLGLVSRLGEVIYFKTPQISTYLQVLLRISYFFGQIDKEQAKHIKTAFLITGILCFTEHCTSHY